MRSFWPRKVAFFSSNILKTAQKRYKTLKKRKKSTFFKKSPKKPLQSHSKFGNIGTVQFKFTP